MIYLDGMAQKKILPLFHYTILPEGQGTTEGFDRLRRQAEELFNWKQVAADDSSADLFGLIHELRVHQAELEIQNLELRLAQQELSELHLFFKDLYELFPRIFS